MSSKVLGDNPFAEPAAKGSSDEAAEATPAAAGAAAAKAKSSPPRRRGPSEGKSRPQAEPPVPKTTGPDADMMGIDAAPHPGAHHPPPPQYG